MKKSVIATLVVAGFLVTPVRQVFSQASSERGSMTPAEVAWTGPGMGRGMMGPMGPMRGPGSWTWMRIRMQAMHSIPREYQGLRNPLSPTKENIEAGGTLYQQFCASCHGPAGLGDGPAAKGLNPPPVPLAYTVPMHMTTDGYLFWRIKEGGQAFGTAMPPWGASLKEDQIWQIILYMRAGFPPVKAESSQEGDS